MRVRNARSTGRIERRRRDRRAERHRPWRSNRRAAARLPSRPPAWTVRDPAARIAWPVGSARRDHPRSCARADRKAGSALRARSAARNGTGSPARRPASDRPVRRCGPCFPFRACRSATVGLRARPDRGRLRASDLSMPDSWHRPLRRANRLATRSSLHRRSLAPWPWCRDQHEDPHRAAWHRGMGRIGPGGSA